MNGIVLGNRYELLEKIGEGGMSEVFKARCNKLNRFVAVKILKKEFCNNPEIVEKFKGEATAIATLSDNNIVNILDVGTQDDINYIVMEYVKGKTLKDVIKQVGKMNYETGISVAIQIARALDCAHRNKIIHRDVKPQNILVTEDGVMKVTDFGIAKSSTSSTITNTSTIMGSAHYLSPEQAKGSFIDCRTDLYSLGVVLYEMVTGTVPFQADSAVAIALKHIQEEPIPPKQLNSKIPDSLNKLILKAMEKEPSKRYQSAKEMIADLQKIKENPNARIDDDENDDEHTIIMSAVTEEIAKQKEFKKNDNNSDDDYDDYDDDYYYDDDDDDGEFGRKGKSAKIKKIVIGVACAVVLILLGAGVYGLSGVFKGGKEIEVPNLVGMDIDKAKSTLEGLNLTLVEAGEETSTEYPEGTIMQMNPEAGTKVKENSEVRVIVSGGENKLKMPDLLEYDLDKAKEILSSYGLKISNTSEAYSDDVAKGEIISQVPAKDTEITKDAEISVVISLGSKIKYTTVPGVSGLKAEDAQSKLSNNGLNVSVTSKETNNKSEDGIVLSQSYGEGATVKSGTTVTITVGQYVEKKEEPAQNNQNTTNKPEDNKNNGNGTTNNSSNSNGNNNGGNSHTQEPNSGNNQDKQPEGPWDEAADKETSANENGNSPSKQ